jgi:hypothetical protein
LTTALPTALVKLLHILLKPLKTPTSFFFLRLGDGEGWLMVLCSPVNDMALTIGSIGGGMSQ